MVMTSDSFVIYEPSGLLDLTRVDFNRAVFVRFSLGEGIRVSTGD